MPNWLEASVVLLMLTNLVLLGSSLGTCVRTVALQGIILGFLPILGHWESLTARVLFIAAVTVLFKGLLLPGIMRWALKSAVGRREVEPFVGYSASLLVGLVALGVSFWLAGKLPPAAGTSALAVPAALFTIMSGLFLIVSRRKAITQALGYLVLENGIYVFGVAVSKELPLMVELGVLLDLFVAIFVMGIAIFRISREFNDIDTDQMVSLKG